MSDFLIPALAGLDPYVPGEQPQAAGTSSSTPTKVLSSLAQRAGRAQPRGSLPPQPLLRPHGPAASRAIADTYGLSPDNVFCGNGSDEVLGFSFLAFADGAHPVTFPAVSYGFYRVFANLFRVPTNAVPLREDFTVPVEPFLGTGGMVVLASNAPTGIALPLAEVERIVRANPDHIVLVDEAYVDFGGESALPLLESCPNLLIVRTFSKSRSLAGARLGYALANAPVIDDLNRVRCSFHPYNINRLSMLAGIEAMRDTAYFESCVQSVVRQRGETAAELRGLGFSMTDSRANFLFAAHPR